MNPDSTYEILSGGKQFPLRDFQAKSLQDWFEGKSVSYFKPKKFKSGKTKKLFYIDKSGSKNEIISVDDDEDDDDDDDDDDDEDE